VVSRLSLLAGLGFVALFFAVVACQVLPVASAAPRTNVIAAPTAQVSTAAAQSNGVVWARVPYCTCRDGVATDTVSASLQRAQLVGTIKILNPTNGWLYFEVVFDPAAASPQQIATAITGGGGEVVAGPP
jgi:hypothetical protein